MKRTLLAFSIATMALTTTADHLVVVKVGGKSFAAKDPSADKSEWKDYSLLPADEKPAYRFFRLVANVESHLQN